MRKFWFGVATTVVASFLVVLVEYRRLMKLDLFPQPNGGN